MATATGWKAVSTTLDQQTAGKKQEREYVPYLCVSIMCLASRLSIVDVQLLREVNRVVRQHTRGGEYTVHRKAKFRKGGLIHFLTWPSCKQTHTYYSISFQFTPSTSLPDAEHFIMAGKKDTAGSVRQCCQIGGLHLANCPRQLRSCRWFIKEWHIKSRSSLALRVEKSFWKRYDEYFSFPNLPKWRFLLVAKFLALVSNHGHLFFLTPKAK